MENQKGKSFIKRKLWPFLVSLGGATVMLLAFFIPSVQEQWDRYQAREVIEQYEQMGNEFFEEERYKMAEEAYAKAFELSEQKRLDIEVKRLTAKVNRISENPDWGSKPPEDLNEIDFQFLLHMEKGKDYSRERLYTLNSYGVFLASLGKIKKAHAAFEEAIQLNPQESHTYINLANLLDQEGGKEEAEKFYLKAITLDPENFRAHYNLGLLFEESGKPNEAEKEFRRSMELDPGDSDALAHYNFIHRKFMER